MYLFVWLLLYIVLRCIVPYNHLAEYSWPVALFLVICMHVIGIDNHNDRGDHAALRWPDLQIFICRRSTIISNDDRKKRPPQTQHINLQLISIYTHNTHIHINCNINLKFLFECECIHSWLLHTLWRVNNAFECVRIPSNILRIYGK